MSDTTIDDLLINLAMTNTITGVPEAVKQAKSALYDLILKEVVGEDEPVFGHQNGLESVGLSEKAQDVKRHRNQLRIEMRNKLKELFGLEASSSQYFSKTSPNGLSFTDEFTCMAWIKMESYHNGGIIAQ